MGHGPGNVRREVGREMLLFYPPVAVAVRLKRLGGLRQGPFDRRTAVTFIECKCGDVDQCGNVWIISFLFSPELPNSLPRGISFPNGLKEGLAVIAQPQLWLRVG